MAGVFWCDAEMLYGDFISIFSDLIALHGKSMAVDFRDLLKCLRGEDTAAADAACRRVSRGQALPPLSPRVKAEVLCRLACGEWYCTDNFHLETAGETQQEFLDSLLIDYWRDGGRSSWLGEAMGGTDAFRPKPDSDGLN